MNSIILVAAVLLAAELASPWERAYVGEEATGSHVLGLWKFDDPTGLDAAGKQPKGELRHGKQVSEGKFGGALESFAGVPVVDQSHGFVVPNNPRLSPGGAFTIELWIKPKPEFATRDGAVLIDKKYAGHTDYQLAIGPADAKQQRRLSLSLGFGSESQNFLSDLGEFPADEWVHIAATYDGKGRVRFFRNGSSFGSVDAPERGTIAAGVLPLSIGDRLGSNYPGFPGWLDEVRLTSGVREFAHMQITTTWPRRAFTRFEEPPTWTVTVTNLRPEPIAGAKLIVAIGESKPIEIALPDIATGQSYDAPLKFDTRLRPDVYPVTISAIAGDKRVVDMQTVTLVARPLPQRMPVVMWGYGDLDRLKQIGFTHTLGVEVDHARVLEATGPTLVTSPTALPAARDKLDAALINGLRILAGTYPSYFEPGLLEYLQVDRDGKPLQKHCLTPNAPRVLEVFERAGESIAMTYADHPAFEGVLVNSEIRDQTDVSFSKWDLEAYRRRFGPNAEFPAWLTSKYPPRYTTLEGFPTDRVVANDHPQLDFYRWWWGGGDGWYDANSAVSRGLHRTSPRKDLWTFTDPVVRCPPLWGSGGEVDVLSQWTYTDPDPIRMALPVDEMFAMASGRRPRARVMKMTQLFWYRSTTAPAESTPREGTNPATWVDQDPDASYISIHPHHLREAVWTKLARPVEGIMFHGWSSLVPTDGSHAYKYTHPQLQHELTRIIREVVEPLGPMLRQVPAVKSDIAFLESFTTFAFTGRGTWGYAGGWQADVYFALQYARLQPEVIYDQHVLRDGLDGYKVLVMVDCEVLTREVVDLVQAFQKQGGIVIGDDVLCPAIKADIVLTRFDRVKDAAKDKAALLKLADEIRSQLDGRYERLVDTSSPEVVPHRRRAGDTDYIFLVNDAREAGDYVGQYGRVHELGVPTTAEVRIRSNAAAVYDLVEHHAVTFRREGTEDTEAHEEPKSFVPTLVVPLTLGPCDGRLLMATAKPIAQISVSGPKAVARGQSWSGLISIEDSARQAIDAVVPLHVEVRDADGRLAEFSGYHAAVEGKLELKLDIASNDRPGIWEVRVHDLASGLRNACYFRVER